MSVGAIKSGLEARAPWVGGLRSLAVFVALLTLWPTWLWYGERMTDGSDEPWGVLALIAAFTISLGRVRYQSNSASSLRATSGQLLTLAFTLLCYGVSSFFLPPLLRAAIAMVAVAYSFSLGQKLHLGTMGLFGISLPIIASMQFFLGYPLRVATTAIASQLLSLLGYSVKAAGTVFLWRGDSIIVDAPCSGIKMLWVGLFLCFFLSAAWKLSTRATWKLYSWSCAIIFLANLTRTCFLFLIESKIVPAPEVAHQGVGVILFALALIAILLFGKSCKEYSGRAEIKKQAPPPSSKLNYSHPFAQCALFLVAIAVGLSAFYRPSTQRNEEVHPRSFPGWPATFEGQPLVALPLLPAELRAARDFPGYIGRFSDGQREIVLRYTTSPTRLLHPASDCLKGSGYSVRPAPLLRDKSGKAWGCVRASLGHRSMTVCEHIYDSAGNSWSDPSSWFWAAIFKQTEGPWWSEAVTM